MTVVVLMSQTLRQREAAKFLRDIRADRKAVVTQFQSDIETALFPADTQFHSWSHHRSKPVSARATSVVRRLKSWLFGGSPAAFRIDRWLRAAEWRLRYLDRIVAVVGSRRLATWDFDNDDLITILVDCFEDTGEGQLVVFDLFDLPTALKFAEGHPVSISVR